MNTLIKAIFLTVFTVLIMMPQAGAQAVNQLEKRLIEYNRIKPMQNPSWERSYQVMKSRILDRKNKVVGELEDIAVSGRGNIQSLQVDLNRMQLGSDVYLNYNNLGIRSADQAFIMDFEEEKIEEAYPQLLANIETASGSDGDTLSIKNLINSDVISADGRRIGKVEEIMFDDNSGNRAEALVIRVRYKTVGGESVAVPFDMPTYKMAAGNRYEVILSDAQVDAVLSIAD